MCSISLGLKLSGGLPLLEYTSNLRANSGRAVRLKD